MDGKIVKVERKDIGVFGKPDTWLITVEVSLENLKAIMKEAI